MKNKYRLALCLALSGAMLAGTTKGGVLSYDSSSIISYASQNRIKRSSGNTWQRVYMDKDFLESIKSVKVNDETYIKTEKSNSFQTKLYYLRIYEDGNEYSIQFYGLQAGDKVTLETDTVSLKFKIKDPQGFSGIIDPNTISEEPINKGGAKPDPGQKQPDGQAGTEDASKYIKSVEAGFLSTIIRMDEKFVNSIESVEVNGEKWQKKSNSSIFDRGSYYLISNREDADGSGVKVAGLKKSDKFVIKTKDKELSFTVNNPSDSASFIKEGSLKIKNISSKTQPDPAGKGDEPGKSQGESSEEKDISFVYASNPFKNTIKLSKGKLDKSKVEKIIINGKLQTEITSPSGVYGRDCYAFSDDGELCIRALGKNHTLSITYAGKEYNYIYDGNKLVENKDKKEVTYKIKLHGEFDSLLVGQKKIDGYTGGSVSVSNNPNSVSVKYTDKDSQKDEDWKKLEGKDSEFTEIKAVISDPDSGIKPIFYDGAVSLDGSPKKDGTFQIWVEATDVSGKKITSNKVECHVHKEGEDKLEDLLKNGNFKQTKDGKYMWDMRPWRVTKFNDSGKEVNVPKGLKAWFGSHKKDVYGELGFETLEEPSQTLVVGEGANLTFKNMKIFGSVKIIVKDGGVLNLDNSVVFGKIEVSNGGKINVNYNPYNNKITDGASISGQIVLKDGAILGKSSIYSHTNWLGQGKLVNTNDKPVIKVEGKAKIEGEVYVRGDHAATHSKHGQPALEVGPNGEVEIGEKSSLYLYGGGMNHLTSVGGDALKLDGGKITGKGKLVAVAGEGIEKQGGSGISGTGNISVAKAYIRGGNGKNPGKALGSDKIKFDGTKGLTIDGKVPTTTDQPVPEDYWHNTFRPSEKVINKIDSVLEENKDKPIKSSPADKKETNPAVPSGNKKPAGKQRTHSTYGTSQGGSTKDYSQKRDLKKYIDQLKEAMMENKIAIKSAKFLLENAPKQVAPVRDKLIKLVENANNIIERSQNILKKLGEIED